MRILLVEDQLLIGKAIRKGLMEESFVVDWVTTLAEGLHMAQEIEYDTLILDLMLPDGSGMDLLKDLRKNRARTPVLILSAKDGIADKIAGFHAGTDDYLTKPFVFDELLLRTQALVRRKYQQYGSTVSAGPLVLDLISRSAACNGQNLSLTSKEFCVLELFLMRRNEVLSRIKIAEHIYSDEAEQGSNVIDVFINKLRRKLEDVGQESLIETVRGEGYVIR